jgi:hypothetical protein
MNLLQHWASLFHTYSDYVIYEVYKEYLKLISDKPEEVARYRKQLQGLLERMNNDINP